MRRTPVFSSSAQRALLKRLCDQYQEMIVWQARRRMPPQEVEEVFSAVVERLLLHLPQIAALTESQQRAYVYSTTRSVIADWYKQRDAERQHVVAMEPRDLERISDRRANPEESVIYREQLTRMKQACGRLPPEQQWLLELKYVQELSDEEIGGQMGLSREAVRQRLSRLRRKLRELLSEEG